MPVELLALEACETEAAVLLSRVQSVSVRAGSENSLELERAGFVEAPAAIECFVQHPLCLDRYPRRYRKSLRRSLDEWRAAGLRIELADIAGFGLKRFIDDVYYPILARTMYARGIAPHFANELDGILSLLRKETLLAFVITPQGRLVGAAVLRPGDPCLARRGLRGALPTGKWYEGLVYALHGDFSGCRRALMIELGVGFAARGFGWLSLGRDLAWCEEGYDTVLVEKLNLADSVVAVFESGREMYRWRPAEHERFVFLEWSRSRERICPTLFGAPAPALSQIAGHAAFIGVDAER